MFRSLFAAVVLVLMLVGCGSEAPKPAAEAEKKQEAPAMAPSITVGRLSQPESPFSGGFSFSLSLFSRGTAFDFRPAPAGVTSSGAG